MPLPLMLWSASAAAGAALSANSRIREVIVGLRGRGCDLRRAFSDLGPENVEVAGFRDVDTTVRAK